MDDLILKHKTFYFNSSENVFVIDNVSKERLSKMTEFTFAEKLQK